MNKIFIDAHVHIHEDVNLSQTFDAAKLNFMYNALKLNYNVNTGFLLLTESYGVNRFSEIENLSSDDFTVNRTNDKNTFVIKFKDNFNLVVVAGKQIVTKQGIEILALGFNGTVEDGKETFEVIDFLKDKEVLTTIPWGFGKWTGDRSSVIKTLLNSNNSKIYFGDNGNRSRVIVFPKLLRAAMEIGIMNLPGSDPLPIANHYKRIGTTGFIIDNEIDLESPFTSLKNKLDNSAGQIKTYISYTPVAKFIIDQIKMQIIKRNRNK